MSPEGGCDAFGHGQRSNEVLAFFADRLTVLLRDQGQRHDLVDAVFALGDDDLVRIVRRVEALDAFLATDDGANLLAGYKRASNILKAEEKKGPLPAGMVETGRPNQPAEETALAFAAAAAATAVDAGAGDRGLRRRHDGAGRPARPGRRLLRQASWSTPTWPRSARTA